MTSDHGSVEPVDASEPTAQHDDLEHWLHGIRTDLTDDRPDWVTPVGAGGGAEVPGDAEASPAVDNDARGPEPRGPHTIGRHRAED
ncbi:hypothetical protein Pme01_54690 [Planosporangium mesophilum]|uniref:Uncharacterized protein n=2 Tax=Planosporangium mesophilum TaxID=689768 RepID=A0A8J3TIN6_9ACTN|nr:hypothetical protein [Planosporangium mesophilum]GII25872.1 hypothetical protein Pme01_54690 [Planosporangium mesophilum]